MRAYSLSAATFTRENWVRRAASAIEALFRAVSRWNTRRGERELLASFDDRMLSDIGLSRADVERVFGKSF